MKKRQKKFNISNKLAYTLIALSCILLLGVGVYAYGTTNPPVFGHTPGEVDSGTFVGNFIFSNGLKISGGVLDMTSQKIINLAAPTAANDAATKAYVDAASEGGVVWAGYTSETVWVTADLGGIRGANQKCNAVFSDSHVCTFDEIIKLGQDYPWTFDVWIVDGSYYSGQAQITKDGYHYDTTLGPQFPMCNGWTSNSESFMGPIMYANGYMGLKACARAGMMLPCCK